MDNEEPASAYELDCHYLGLSKDEARHAWNNNRFEPKKSKNYKKRKIK